jgi:hypothetical protein
VGGLSVVLVNWNGGVVIGECLDSLTASERCGERLEVLLVDNASSDGSAARALDGHPTVRLIQNRQNVGFARAVNQGLRETSGDLVLVMNPDVTLRPTTIPTLVEAMGREPRAGIAGPRLLDPGGTVQASARREPSLWTGLFGRSTLLTRLLPRNALSRRELPALSHEGALPLEVDWVSGACLIARRAAFERVGPLDEAFFLFWEDADWCRRHRQAGWTVLYVPAAVATHRTGVSRAQRPLRSTIDFHVSAYRYYRKHHLRSPWHPMMGVLVGGLLLSFVRRSLHAALAGRT